MRVLFVATNIRVPGFHGGSAHVSEVCRALRRSHDVRVLARLGSRGPGVCGIGLGTAPGPAGYALVAAHWSAAVRAALRFRPDVIYERGSAQGLGAALGLTLGTPVVTMVLDTEASWLSLRCARRLVTTTPSLVPEKHRPKVVRVSWGADERRFHPRAGGQRVRRSIGCAPEEFLVAYAGGFYPWHGLDVLVRAAQRLPRERFRFLLVGDGRARRSVERSIAASGLRSRFHLVGKVAHEAVPDYLAAADACVAAYDPSKHPSMRARGMFYEPLKVFESMACGKPTVTLDSRNLRDLFDDGRHVLLVPPGRPDALAAALAGLEGRADRGRSIGAEGRRRVVERFTWSRHAEVLTAVFEEATRARLRDRRRGGRPRSARPGLGGGLHRRADRGIR